MQRLQKWNLSWSRLKIFDLLILFLLSAFAIALHVLSVSAGSSSFMQFVPNRTAQAMLYPILTISKEDHSSDNGQSGAVLTYTIPMSISEGFEAGVVPPSGWTLIQTNPNQTWEIATARPTPQSGSYYAAVKCDLALLDQDELLLSPAFTADTGSVSLWSFGSLYWCRDIYDNCDLEVWFVNGSWGGGDDALLGRADDYWTHEWGWRDSTFDFSPHASGNPARIALRYTGNDGAKIGVDDIIITYSPPFYFTKSSAPPGEVHEGDVIIYTISYTNTSHITQTMTITDVLPFNVTLIPGSVSPPVTPQGSTLVWDLDDVPPGGSGEVFFQVRVPLLPSLHGESVTALCPPPEPPSPARVLPVPIVCDTTRFWANGVTRQPPKPSPHTIEVQIPSGASPSAMWLAVKGANDIYLTVDGTQATRIATSSNQMGSSLWSAPITTDAVASGVVTVVTGSPRRLNALFLFDENDPPFDEAALDDFFSTTKTFTYTLDMPSVVTQTMDVILPFMDITYWTDDLLPDDRMTTVTVEFDGQSHTVSANDPNLGNGLLMTQFPFTIGPFTDTITSTKVLTVTVDTEDDIYTLGPRVCRPVYIENTAWLCSQQAGCISDTATNIPEDFLPPGAGDLYLPLILKSYP